MKYKIKNEYINIDNYSPFWKVNEVSKNYRKKPFLLPIVAINNKIIPMHPDTLNDLNLDVKILFYIKVYPTSSFRTVYYKNKNIFIKLPLTRKITRSTRLLSDNDLERSKKANDILKNIHIKGFNYLEEIPIFNDSNNLNYIIRLIPNKKLKPLFTIIKQHRYSKERMIKLIKRMIDIWLKLAKEKIFLEFHTQNILIDDNDFIYYRDLSDVRSIKYNILPSYKIREKDLMTLSFDKTFCTQNLDHILRYYKTIDKKDIIKYINKKIKEYKLEFPNYSLEFSKTSTERIPIKTKLIEYRKKG